MNSFFIFATAMIFSVALTPVARMLALRLGVMDHPHPRKLHRSPMPRLGGIALYAAVALAALFFSFELRTSDPRIWRQFLAVLGGGTVIAAIGLMDDRGYLRPLTKLFVAMPLSALILIAGGIRVTAWPAVSAFQAQPPLYSITSFALTLGWVVVVVSAFNILDHMDGLCAGVTAIASAFFLIHAAHEGQIIVGTLAAAMLGANLGFLFWNSNPAKIFMGDAGALFLGFMMAALGIKLRFVELPPVQSWSIPVLILGVPIFDAALVTVSRLRRGLCPFTSPGKDHTAHRLANLGLGQRNAGLVMYGGGILLGLAGLWVPRLTVPQTYALVGTIVLIAAGCIAALERAPYERQGLETR